MSESLARWAQCEARAVHEPPRRRGPVKAWAWLGVLVRCRLLGIPDPAQEPSSLQLVEGLATAAAIRTAADGCASAGRRKLDGMDITLLQPGAMGFVDLDPLMLGYRGGDEADGGGDVVVRVVATHLIEGAWLRIAAALGEADPNATKWGAVLHVPYTRPGYAGWEQRPAAALLDAHVALSARRADVVDRGKPPVRSPGHHCAGCRVAQCAVRQGR